MSSARWLLPYLVSLGALVGAFAACAPSAPTPTGPRSEPLESLTARDLAPPLCGTADGCLQAAEVAAGGTDGRAPDLTRARPLYRDACEVGSAEACRALAIWASDGSEPDPERARAFFQQALGLFRRDCTRGDEDACQSWVEQVEFGLGARPEPDRAVLLARRHCERMPRACRTFARMLKRRLRFADAAAAWLRACEGGVAMACREAAESYRRSKGVTLDLKRAEALSQRHRDLLWRECTSGPSDDAAMACVSYAVAASRGPLGEAISNADQVNDKRCAEGHWRSCLATFGNTAPEAQAWGCEAGMAQWCEAQAAFEKDAGRTERAAELRARAHRLMESGCARGIGDECERRARAATHDGQTDVSTQYSKRAARVFAGRCERGDGPACGRLALVLETTRGAEPADGARAMAALERQCQLGAGCGSLGRALQDGQLGPPDRRRAYEVLRQACNNHERHVCLDVIVMLRRDGDELNLRTLLRQLCARDPDWCT